MTERERKIAEAAYSAGFRAGVHEALTYRNVPFPPEWEQTARFEGWMAVKDDPREPSA